MEDDREQINYLKSLTTETYLKDIVSRNAVRKQSELSSVFDILASCIGSFINPNKISKTFLSNGHGTISSNTIDKYILYFEEAFVLCRGIKYNIKNYISLPEDFILVYLGTKIIAAAGLYGYTSDALNKPCVRFELFIKDQYKYPSSKIEIINAITDHLTDTFGRCILICYSDQPSDKRIMINN